MMKLKRKPRLLVVATTVAALLAIPSSFVLASHDFSDVSTSAFYHNSVNAIANAGITAGCNRAGTRYCPNDPVTRGQMAVFLDKLGGLSLGPGGVPQPRMDAGSDQGSVVHRFFRTVVLLSGPGQSECSPAMALEFPADFGQYALVFKLYETPAAINPALVNVQLRDAQDDPPDEFEICLATTNGSALPVGEYKLFGTQMTFIGQRRFG